MRPPDSILLVKQARNAVRVDKWLCEIRPYYYKSRVIQMRVINFDRLYLLVGGAQYIKIKLPRILKIFVPLFSSRECEPFQHIKFVIPFWNHQ